MSKTLRDFLNYFDQGQENYPWQLTAEAITPNDTTELTEEEAADLDQRSARFFASLGTLVGDEQGIELSTTMDTLFNRVAKGLPKSQWLDIVKICQAKRTVAQEYGEQLTLAIAELLPQWNSDDRSILMRNYAGAFRSGGNARALKPDADKAWEEMSAVEQGQHLVAIADAVLKELNKAES